jgi:hypothetical protein
MQRGWFKSRTSWHKWGWLHHCARLALYRGTQIKKKYNLKDPYPQVWANKSACPTFKTTALRHRLDQGRGACVRLGCWSGRTESPSRRTHGVAAPLVSGAGKSIACSLSLSHWCSRQCLSANRKKQFIPSSQNIICVTAKLLLKHGESITRRLGRNKRRTASVACMIPGPIYFASNQNACYKKSLEKKSKCKLVLGSQV